MAGETDPLPQLRAIRDDIRRIDARRRDLTEGRDLLIRRAAESGATQEDIADAAGLSQSRIQEVITGGR